MPETSNEFDLVSSHDSDCYAFGSVFQEGHVCMNKATVRATEQARESMSDIPKEHVSILQEAEKIINGQRREDYGPVSESFERISGLFSAYLGVPVSSHDVAMLMVLLKVARSKRGIMNNGEPQRDSLVDIAGYVGCSEKISRGM